jgi:CBS domain containing-hemolysin-like protein
VVDSGGRFTGFVHIKDMLDLVDHPDAAISASAVRHLPRLAADMALPDALSRLRQTNSHLALLTGDNGEVCGMVTLEDLVEDLVGTVRDGTHRT